MSLLELAMDALALPGGEAAGAELLGGLLAAGGLAAYFGAALAIALACTQRSGAEAGLRLLTQQPLERLPLAVLVDAVAQVLPFLLGVVMIMGVCMRRSYNMHARS